MMRRVLLALPVLFLLCAGAWATTRYVQPNGIGSGTDFTNANACPSIAACTALARRRHAGDCSRDLQQRNYGVFQQG